VLSLPLSLIVVWGGAPSAFAATVIAEDSTVFVIAPSGETNHLRTPVSRDEVEAIDGIEALWISDTQGGALVAGAGCKQQAPDAVSCGIAAVQSLEVQLGDGDDSINPPTNPPSSSFFEPTGPFARVEIGGGSGDDLLGGTYGVDHLLGSGGRDDLEPGRGDDWAEGDTGSDRLHGGYGNDLLQGQAGADKIIGADGGDSLRGGAGADRLDGRAGADSLFGGPGDDWLDSADRSYEADRTIDCGPGKDVAVVDRWLDPSPRGCERIIRRS
jgi:Ca2+-binding RTX toxin-like protein